MDLLDSHGEVDVLGHIDSWGVEAFPRETRRIFRVGNTPFVVNLRLGFSNRVVACLH